MISTDFASQQVRRLSGLPKYPREQAGVDELAATLAKNTRSEAHAKSTVDELVRSERCPIPDEIIRVAWGLLTDEEHRQCGHCNNTGWVHFTKVLNGIPYDYSASCRRCRAAAAPDAAPQTGPKRKRSGGLQPASTRNMFGGGGE